MSSLPNLSPTPLTQDCPLPEALVQQLLAGQTPPVRVIEETVLPFRLRIDSRPGGLALTGDAVALRLGVQMLEPVSRLMQTAGPGDEAAVRRVTAAVVETALKHDLAFRLAGIRAPLRPMTLGQVAFLNAMLFGDRSLILGLGPTGTGKTHLAVVAGLSLVAEGRFKSLVITRPHVLLEGEVMTPSLRAETIYDEQFAPIEDELRELISPDEIKRLTAEGRIEIAPLGRIRGRTFNESFIVVDEAQNTTVGKMRMAVTRLGRASRMVITGDPAQIDLPSGEVCGLSHLLELLAGTDLALVHRFELDQIIRHPLVAQLETLYSGGADRGLKAAA